MRYARKYPDDMVENLAESAGMCSDGPGSAPIEIPKEGVLSWERARERWKNEALVGFEKKGTACLTYIARPRSHQHAARADSPWHTRGQSTRCADGPAPRHRRSVICIRTSSTTPSATDLCGRSAPHRRTVCHVPRTVRPAPFFFLFQLDIFRDKDLNMNLLGSLLKNNEEIFPYDPM
jgi:hypothetical protein